MQAVYEFGRRRRRIGQNAQPCERIRTLIDADVRGGNRRPANTMKPVAAGDEIASNLVRFIIFPEPDLRLRRFEIVHGHIAHFEQ